MNTGAETLLEGADGALNFPNVAVGGNDVHGGRQNIATDTLELTVSVQVAHSETTAGVELDHSKGFAQDGGPGPVGDRNGGAETDAPARSYGKTAWPCTKKNQGRGSRFDGGQGQVEE
jgi:hypothetical protein